MIYRLVVVWVENDKELVNFLDDARLDAQADRDLFGGHAFNARHHSRAFIKVDQGHVVGLCGRLGRMTVAE